MDRTPANLRPPLGERDVFREAWARAQSRYEKPCIRSPYAVRPAPESPRGES